MTVAKARGAGETHLAGPFLQIQLRATDRPGLLAEVFARLGRAIQAQGARQGVSVGPVSTWSALFRVIDGRTLIGRATLRLPESGDWTVVDWNKVADRLFEPAALGDSMVLRLELLRVWGQPEQAPVNPSNEWSLPTTRAHPPRS